MSLPVRESHAGQAVARLKMHECLDPYPTL